VGVERKEIKEKHSVGSRLGEGLLVPGVIGKPRKDDQDVNVNWMADIFVVAGGGGGGYEDLATFERSGDNK